MSTLEISGGQVLRPDSTVEWADVLVDVDAGEIVDIGDIAGTGDDRLDASDGLVVPGFVNAHTHVAMTLLRGYADDKPLQPWLEEDIWPVEAELAPGDVRAGAALGALEMIESGTTAFSDMYFFESEIADVVEEAGLRARLGYGIITAGRDEAAAREEFETGLRFAREYDGAADGRVHTALMPHSLTTVDESPLREFAERARSEDIPIHFHANETRDEVDPVVEEHGTRPLVYADDLGLLTEDSYVAHCVHLDDREIELLARRGTSVAHCPAANTKLASGMAPVQRLLDAGVAVGLGTDGPASNNSLDVVEELRDAAMVGKLATGDASAVDAPTALHMATLGSARAAGLPGGRVTTGHPADLAVVDLAATHLTPVHDEVSNLVYAARGSDVRHTVCDGRVLMRDGEVRTLDPPAVREAAADRARALVERAEG